MMKVYYCNEYNFDCEKLLYLLPEERAEKYHRLRFEKDKKNCVGVYLLLIKALKEYGVDEFTLGYTETGKPYIKGNPLYFNFSHSKNGFACAVSKKEIGADIQEIVTPKEATLKKVCTEKELPFAAKDKVGFTRLWTLKESIIKKSGGTIADCGKYEFATDEKDFYAYGNRFVSLVEDDFVLTVCGEYDKAEFIKVKPTEF